LGYVLYAYSSQCCQLGFGKNNSHIKFKYDTPSKNKKSDERTKAFRRQNMKLPSIKYKELVLTNFHS